MCWQAAESLSWSPLWKVTLTQTVTSSYGKAGYFWAEFTNYFFPSFFEVQVKDCLVHVYNVISVYCVQVMTFHSSPPSFRWSATSVCLRAAQGHTVRRGTCEHTRRHTVASIHSFVINRAVERPSSLHTVSRSMSVFTPRRSRLSVMCKAVRKPSTHYTGEPICSFVVLCFISPHGTVFMVLWC